MKLLLLTLIALLGGCATSQQQDYESNYENSDQQQQAVSDDFEGQENYDQNTENGNNNYANVNSETEDLESELELTNEEVPEQAEDLTTGEENASEIDEIMAGEAETSNPLSADPLEETEELATNTEPVMESPTPAPQQALPVVQEAPPIFNDLDRDVMAQFADLWWVGYHYDLKGQNVKVRVLTKGHADYDLFHERNRAQQPELVLRFYNTQLNPRIRRDIDASEFLSPVAYVRMRSDSVDGRVDVVITVRDPVKPKLFARNGNIQLTFPLGGKYLVRKNLDDAKAANKAEVISPSKVTPELEENSEAPKTAQLRRPYVPNPGGGALDKAPEGTEIVPTELEEVPAENTDFQGLPTNDFDNQQPANLQIYHLRTSSVLGVAQDNYDNSLFNNPAQGVDNGLNLSNDSVPQNQEILNESLSEENPAQAQVVEQSDILGSNTEEVQNEFTGTPVRLEFFQAPLSEVLRAFAEQSGTNFVYPDSVGRVPVTIKLKDVPWDAALNAILETNRLGMAKVSNNVIRIDLITSMADYLRLRREAHDVKLDSEPRKLLVVRLSHATAAQLAGRLTTMLELNRAGRGRITADSDTNKLFIEAPASLLARAKQIIERFDVQVPQVEIASRLVEVNRNVQNFMGISWTGTFGYDANRGLGFGTLNFPNSMTSAYAVDPGVNQLGGTPGTINLNFGSINDVLDLGLRLKMEESKGTAEVLQSTRVLVRDRQAATITAGTSVFTRTLAQPNFEVSAAEDASSQGGGRVARVSFNLSMNVTPEVTNDGLVRMNVNMNSSVPVEAPFADAPMASSNRNLSTQLIRKSGDTAVIGGIYDTRKTKKVVGVPFLSRLPIIGALFRSTTTSESQTELMMMITPTIKPAEDQNNSSALPEESVAVNSSSSGEYEYEENNSASQQSQYEQNSGNNATQQNSQSQYENQQAAQTQNNQGAQQANYDGGNYDNYSQSSGNVALNSGSEAAGEQQQGDDYEDQGEEEEEDNEQYENY